jgi:hypothetical protein
MSYVTVTNRPNRISTVHKSGCAYLGDYGPLTASSERFSSHDGLAALAHACRMMPNSFTFCGHCLKEFSGVLAFKKTNAGPHEFLAKGKKDVDGGARACHRKSVNPT